MKKFYVFLFISLCTIFLIGCVVNPVMPPIEYNNPIGFNDPHNAFLYWEIGKQNTSTVASNANNSIGAVIESIDRKNNPSRYILTYGKAEQAIFITSFKNILEKQSVFKSVALITDHTTIKPNAVLITIYFRTTRVGSPEMGYPISLTVDMSISGAGKPTFNRTFFVKNDSRFENFQIRQNKISTKLAEELICGLKKWHTEIKN